VTSRQSDEISLDIVLALCAGAAAVIVVVALAAGFCYVSGVAFRAGFLWAGVVCGAIATVVTLRHLERPARSKAQ